MVLHAFHDGSRVIVSLKPHSVALSVDDRHVVVWDRGGRLYSVVRDGVTWRRGLSGHVLEKHRADGNAHRRYLPEAEADAMVEEAADLARRTSLAMAGADWHWTGGLDPATALEARTWLMVCARFDAATARHDAEHFAAVYRPVGILPPDQYLSLVLQATEGCSFNTCTFCDLYRNPYRVKTVDEFRTHVRDVFRYLGASAGLRSRGIFLGSANALAVPMARLLPLFEVLTEDADAVRRGVYAFVDGFTGQIKHTTDYRRLGSLGLRRVYVGLESGHDPLLAFVRKPGSAEFAIETVRAIKDAGVQVGVIVMTGLGGERYAEAHVADTAEIVSRMGLSAGDLLYFSQLVESAAVSYPRLAVETGIRPLDGDACRRQRDAIRAMIRFPGTPPLTTTYDIREFVY